MQERDYSYPLMPGSDVDILHIKFRKNRGKIEHFVIQYVTLIGGEHHEIIRFDTCHDYAHKHTFHGKSDEFIVDLTGLGDELNEVYTQSLEYIKTNFPKIKQNYLST